MASFVHNKPPVLCIVGVAYFFIPEMQNPTKYATPL